MKKLLIASSFLIAQQAMACFSFGPATFCVGDVVYKGDSYYQGATILSENPYNRQVTVRANSNYYTYTDNVQDLFVTKGCLGNFCVNQTVYKRDSYTQGATILALNFFTNRAVVRANSNYYIYTDSIDDLELTQGCLDDICVGDLLYKGTAFTSGAKVLAYNYTRRTLTVRSESNYYISSEAASEMYATKGCVGSICVGAKVRTGSYPYGATVLAVSANKYKAVVRSDSNYYLYDENIYNLGGLPQPQPNPWPQPNPQPNPWPQPNPQPQPNPWPQPPRPRPDPRPPVPTYVDCTVNRLDPSGAFITSYVGTATTYGEACRIATNDCSRDLKGRQTCNIAR